MLYLSCLFEVIIDFWLLGKLYCRITISCLASGKVLLFMRQIIVQEKGFQDCFGFCFLVLIFLDFSLFTVCRVLYLHSSYYYKVSWS